MHEMVLMIGQGNYCQNISTECMKRFAKSEKWRSKMMKMNVSKEKKNILRRDKVETSLLLNFFAYSGKNISSNYKSCDNSIYR